MTKPSTRDIRRQQLRQSILDAARRIISQGGVGSLNMRAIASEINYSPAAIYEYFDGKQEIVETVCYQGYRRLAQYMQQVDESLPPSEHLTQLGLAYLRFALENPEFYLVMFTTVPSDEAAQEIRAEGSTFDTLLQAIQRGVDEGVFKTRKGFNARNMAYASWAHVHGIAMLLITFLSKPEILSELANRETIEAFFRGLEAG